MCILSIYIFVVRLPDGPSEPDIENVEPADPKFIPLEDVSFTEELI